MARCWTCGLSVSGYRYRCSACADVPRRLQSIEREVESLHETISEGFADLARIQEAGFNQLSDQLSEIATILEWGFGELSWQFQQQIEVLRSIDHTLKTRAETQANEWRLHAEELRRRGVLDESEEFFLKALNEYRLDYRIYVGLAETYLQMNKFDKAMAYLEKSLPHAPKKEIDYKSYSYRLIGHIHACEEDYNRAVAVLRTSIELSPTYEKGHYDYAQYSAQMRNRETCISSLQKAILAKPFYWYLAQKERNFDPVRSEIEKFISRISMEASNRAKDAIIKAERVINQAREGVSQAKVALSVSRDKAELESSTICEDAETKLKLAKEKVASGDYVAFLEAKTIAEKSYDLANNALNAANREQEHYQKRRIEKVKNAWAGVPATIWIAIVGGFYGLIFGGVGGCTIGMFTGSVEGAENWLGIGGGIGLLLGVAIGIIIGIYEVKNALK